MLSRLSVFGIASTSYDRLSTAVLCSAALLWAVGCSGGLREPDGKTTADTYGRLGLANDVFLMLQAEWDEKGKLPRDFLQLQDRYLRGEGLSGVRLTEGTTVAWTLHEIEFVRLEDKALIRKLTVRVSAGRGQDALEEFDLVVLR